MLEMECESPPSRGSAPEGSMRRSGRQSKSRTHSRDVKEKVRLVVGGLETVVTELRAIVVDLRLLVHQIDIVTAKLDSKLGLDWQSLEKDSQSEANNSVSDKTIRQSSPPRTDGYIQCSCNRLQLHRIVYLPIAEGSIPQKMAGLGSGYCLDTGVVGKGFKPKLLPCLDYNQNESFDTEYLDTITTESGGSELLLKSNATSEEESRCGLSDLDKFGYRPKTNPDSNAIWEKESYSGFYENDVDDKLENYVNMVDSFESSDEDDGMDLESFRLISSLPDATDAKNRYDMVSSWAECAMISLASDNLTSEESEVLPEDSGKSLVPVKEENITKSTIGEYNFVSDVVLFQNEVQADVGQYRSVLVF